ENVHHYATQDFHGIGARREARIAIFLEGPYHELVQAEEDFILAGDVVIESRLLQSRSLCDHVHVHAVVADLVEEGGGTVNDFVPAPGGLYNVDLGAAPGRWLRRRSGGHRAVRCLVAKRSRSLLLPFRGLLCSLHLTLLGRKNRHDSSVSECMRCAGMVYE